MNKKLLFALLLASKASFAQNSILAGKITDENNRPIAGALIQVTHDRVVSEARSDGDGLYYTGLMPDGMYRVDVHVDGKWYKGRKVYLEQPVSYRHKYYDLRIVNERLAITVDDGDPFLASQLRRIETEQKDIDIPPSRTGILESVHFLRGQRNDSLKLRQTPGEHVPQAK